MNFTILSIVTTQALGASPLFAGKSCVNSFSSTFSRSFAPIFYSQNIREYNFKFNSFSFILSSAVVLSSEDQENKKFGKKFSDNGDLSNVKITNCLFLKCTSKENGGGVFIGSPTSITAFTLKSTGFYQCQSKCGDAFYSQTGSIDCQGCCIDKCSSSAFYIKEKDSFDFQYISISNSKLNSDIDETPAFNKFDCVNLSYNTDTIRISSTSESEVYLSSCEFNSNAGDFLFVISSQKIIGFFVQNTNFKSNNFASSIINAKTDVIRVLSCFFNEDKSKYYIKCLPTSSVRIENCVFSDTELKENGKILATIRPENCVYQKPYTTSIFFPATNECWNKMPKTLPPIHLDGKTIFTFGAVIILAIGFIFIVCKLKNRNRYTNTMTMYTK